MINRTLIRRKTVQMVYSYYQLGDANISNIENDLLVSLSKAYELYNQMFLLIIAVTDYAKTQVAHQQEMNKVMHLEQKVDSHIADNKFALQLKSNITLAEFMEKHKKSAWTNEPVFVKHIYEKIKTQDFYKEYAAVENTTYEEDREFWNKAYRHVIVKDELITEILEDSSMYWNDDSDIVDSFIIKSINRFDAKNGDAQELLPEYKSEEDREFARLLIRNALLNADVYRNYIKNNVHNWDFDRLAFMDVIIMQVALAEMMSFPEIPVSVTINEYVEIAKWYSTPKSGGYINAIIDAVARSMRKDGKIFKA